eukprot:9497722-Pyramimonas_sp.AAC.2
MQPSARTIIDMDKETLQMLKNLKEAKESDIIIHSPVHNAMREAEHHVARTFREASLSRNPSSGWATV